MWRGKMCSLLYANELFYKQVGLPLPVKLGADIDNRKEASEYIKETWRFQRNHRLYCNWADREDQWKALSDSSGPHFVLVPAPVVSRPSLASMGVCQPTLDI